MLHAGIQQDEAVSFRIEWEVFILQSLAVQADEAALLAEAGSELVHNSALDSAVVVLGALAYTGELELVDAVAEEVVQRECKAALEGG